jgi:hypothetical protein
MNAACGRIPARTMKKPARLMAAALLTVWLSAWSGSVYAAPCTSQSSGNWNSCTTWSGLLCLLSCGGIIGGTPNSNSDVTISNGDVVTVNVANAAANTVTIEGGSSISSLAFSLDHSLTVTNNVTINAPTASVLKVIDVVDGTLTVGGNVTLTGGTTATRDALLRVNAGLITINGGLTINQNGTTPVSDSSTASITNAAGRITVNGAAGVTNNDTVSVGLGTFSVTNASATFTNNNVVTVSSGLLNVTGAYTNTASGDTITISNSAGRLTAGGTLTNGGSIIFTGAGTVNANGAFISSGTVTNTAAGTLNIKGTATVNGTFTAGSGTVVFNGSSAQSVSGSALGFYNVTMNNANGITLGNNLTASGTLTFTSGKINTASNHVTVGTNGVVSGASGSAGYVVGYLEKLFPTGASSFTFDIGDATTYTPVPVSVSATGNLMLSTATPDHPNIGTSLFDPNYTVNRYWTVGSSAVPGTYSATFNYLSGEIDADADPANFQVQRYAASAWTTATVGTRTGTSTQATGLAAVGDFAIGEFQPVLGSFNAVEAGANEITGKIKTKVAGTSFNLDLVALNAARNALNSSFKGTVKVELLDSSSGGTLDSNGCNAGWPLIQTLSNQLFLSAGAGRKASVAFQENNSYPNVSVRISYPATGTATLIGCSGDHYANRPASLVINSVSDADWQSAGSTNNLTNLSVTATPIHKAGRPFTINATAKNSLGTTTTNYAGSPDTASLTACTGTACTASFGTLAPGTWAAASGTVTTNTATYSDVGAFRLQLVDTNFASVDATDGSTDYERFIYSNTFDAGRFVPDHFALSVASIANRSDITCPACTFTYMGEQMNAVFTLTAQAAANTTTVNYAGSGNANDLARFNPAASGNPLNLAAVNSTATPTYLSARLDTSLAASGSFVSGAASVIAPLAITRGTTADGPYALLDIGIAPQDSDGIVMNAYNLDADAVSGYDHTLAGRSEVRYGQMKLGNAHGSELLPLPIAATVQYWNGTIYATSTGDSQSSFVAPANLTFSNRQRLTANPAVVGAPASVTITGGIGGFTFAAPNAPGSVDITANAPSYLPGNTARASFGVYKGNNGFIYMRENY